MKQHHYSRVLDFRGLRLTVLGMAVVLLAACSDPSDERNTPADNSTPADNTTPLTSTPSDPPELATSNEALANEPGADEPGASASDSAQPFVTTEVTQFTSPWAMTFLPDGRLLVTEMAGSLHVYDPDSDTTGEIDGVPEVVHVSQGGLGDVVLHPDYANNSLVYISYVEPGEEGLGAAVARAQLALDGNDGTLDELEVIWRQTPKKSGEGHFGYRLVFDDDGLLWISSSERQEFDPAQDLGTNLGKILRLNDDGSLPDGNPFADQGEVAAQVWSLGHRNILGMAFAADGRLWAHEMGPKGGDELNLIEKGTNYGYPLVSNGNHYDDTPMPDHDTRPEFRAPVITWDTVISPAGFVIYDGEQFTDWHGNGFIGGLSAQTLVRVEFDGDNAHEVERFDMQRRIREVEQGPEGALWLLEDGTRGGNGWLLKLTPESSS